MYEVSSTSTALLTACMSPRGFVFSLPPLPGACPLKPPPSDGPEREERVWVAVDAMGAKRAVVETGGRDAKIRLEALFCRVCVLREAP